MYNYWRHIFMIIIFSFNARLRKMQILKVKVQSMCKQSSYNFVQTLNA